MKCPVCELRQTLPGAPICDECADVLVDVVKDACECPTCVQRNTWDTMYPTARAVSN